MRTQNAISGFCWILRIDLQTRRQLHTFTKTRCLFQFFLNIYMSIPKVKKKKFKQEIIKLLLMSNEEPPCHRACSSIARQISKDEHSRSLHDQHVANCSQDLIGFFFCFFNFFYNIRKKNSKTKKKTYFEE